MTTSLQPPVQPAVPTSVPSSGTVDEDTDARPLRAPALPADERRAAIVAAATPLLREFGRGVTTRQIADAAGIAEGTIFRVFDTKEQLLDAVVEHVLDVSETVSAIRSAPAAAPLAERVHYCATVLTEWLSSVFDVMIAWHKRGPAPEPGDAGSDAKPHRNPYQERDRRQAEVLDALTDVLAPDRDRLRCSPARAAHLLRLMAFAGTHRMITYGDRLTPEEITDVLLHGITRPES
ncbi:MAG: TetR/AcrR family transcriptional regulator [Actinobacteria bacterium]|jgi:AcrR family transcriptional regulator|nr:TetR/AcrR family transcriptional regulator [Actinomycetota bacterium]